MLEKFLVTPHAESVYLELLRKEPSSLDELAGRCGLKTSAMDETLTELIGHGLVVRNLTARLGWQVVAPHAAVDQLIARAEERLRAERDALEGSREQLLGLLDGFVDSRVRRRTDVVETIEDSSVVRARLYQLVREASEFVWATHPGPALSPAATQESLALDQFLAGAGIYSQILVSRESLGPDHWTAYLEAVVALGHRVRIMASIPLLLVVIDGQTAVVPSVGPTGAIGAHVVHSSSLTAPAATLFQRLWNEGTPYDRHVTSANGQHDGISEERMREVAVLMAGGMKDEAVARRLGVSDRTVRRIVFAMSEYLGADSRFQAACLAMRAGWLSAMDPLDRLERLDRSPVVS